MILKALIFDVDGTLAETEDAHREAFNETFAERGLDWHWDDALYRELLRVTGGKERIRAWQRVYLKEEPLDEAALFDLHKRKTARYGEIVASGGLSLRPGIAELFALGREKGLKIAAATTTNRPNINALCRSAWGRDADSVFDVIAAGDEVQNKKPAPDVYLLALTRLDLPSTDCIAFEDSEAGLKSALGAGLRTLVSPSRFTADHDFTGAFAIAESLAEFAELLRVGRL